MPKRLRFSMAASRRYTADCGFVPTKQTKTRQPTAVLVPRRNVKCNLSTLVQRNVEMEHSLKVQKVITLAAEEEAAAKEAAAKEAAAKEAKKEAAAKKAKKSDLYEELGEILEEARQELSSADIFMAGATPGSRSVPLMVAGWRGKGHFDSNGSLGLVQSSPLSPLSPLDVSTPLAKELVRHNYAHSPPLF